MALTYCTLQFLSVVTRLSDALIVFLTFSAPLVKFSPLSEMDRNKFVEIGNPIVLYCELSDPAAPVHWYKDGSKLHPQSGVDILTDGIARKLIVHSAEVFHSGLYCCKTKGDTTTFSVDIKGDMFYLK
uniref:Ig-like domain-containing protein n=1 Tax=Stegastes partitus TaxID=144197 RepID=A0A3B4ZM65_9TELE